MFLSRLLQVQPRGVIPEMYVPVGQAMQRRTSQAGLNSFNQKHFTSENTGIGITKITFTLS